jgi:hypothetical protein
VNSITGQLNGAQIVGDITNVGSIYANGYIAARQSLYSDGAVYSNDYAARNGSASAAFYGNASTANAATTVTGQVNGAQIVGNLNVGNINASGSIISNGYVYGIGGLLTDNAVYSNTYVDRYGGGGANFFGNASTANYAASTDVGILYQGQAGVSSSYYCDPGYYLKFYDTNVDSTNNAFFYGCVAYGH